MRGAPLSRRWAYALKPGSWPKLLVAALLGQAIGVGASGTLHLGALAFGAAFTVLHTCSVVLLNDWGDQDVDALKRRLYPELSSKKTIVDGVLEAHSVLLAGAGACVCALAVAVTAQAWLGRPGLTIGAVGCVGLFIAYTLPPVRLNYRGGGELLEMVGVGFALPWWNAYLQSGVGDPVGMVLLPGFAVLALSSALASGLSDEPSDRLGGKRTFATAFGARAVRQAVEGLVLGALIVWGLLPVFVARVPMWLMIPPVVVLAVEYRDFRGIARAADVATYPGTSAFKHHLHMCIWRSTSVLALLMTAVVLLRGAPL